MKVSVSLKRGAHFHIFTRSPFFGRPGPKSLKIGAKSVPKIYQNSPKTHVCLIFFLRDFQHRFLTKNGSKMGPQNGAPSYFLDVHFYFFSGTKLPAQNGVELGPQGSILGSFWLHFEAPRLHFEVILDHLLPPSRLKFGAMRFLCLLFSCLSVFCFLSNITPRPPRQNTFKHILSTRLSQTLPYHKGAAVSRSVLRYKYITTV